MASKKYTFTGVCIHKQDHIYVSCIADELGSIEHGAVFRWLGKQWANRSYTFSLATIVQTSQPTPLVISVGVTGEMDLFTNPGGPGKASEHVDKTDNGPSTLVPLRCARNIVDHIYVAGMARHVYRRDDNNVWSAIDEGVFVPRSKRTDAVGFNAIDGLSENAIYTVGYQGEIWLYDGKVWTQQESPTKVALTCVKCTKDNTVYAAGMGGVLLRTHKGRWEIIKQNATRNDFWSMTIFKDKIYLATNTGLFVLDGDALKPIDMKLKSTPTTFYLDANDGVMWSVGEKDLTFTTDGKVWTEVPAPE